jgi:hypothetical protein
MVFSNNGRLKNHALEGVTHRTRSVGERRCCERYPSLAPRWLGTLQRSSDGAHYIGPAALASIAKAA